MLGPQHAVVLTYERERELCESLLKIVETILLLVATFSNAKEFKHFYTTKKCSIFRGESDTVDDDDDDDDVRR